MLVQNGGRVLFLITGMKSWAIVTNKRWKSKAWADLLGIVAKNPVFRLEDTVGNQCISFLKS
jgi:hypothetical protein